MDANIPLPYLNSPQTTFFSKTIFNLLFDPYLGFTFFAAQVFLLKLSVLIISELCAIIGF